MSTNHTPGPWRFEEHDGNYEIWNHNTKVAVVNQAHEIDDEKRSLENLENAHLLAAAPDLLNALIAMRDTFDKVRLGGLTKGESRAIRLMGEAINKARGGK